jgi:hypothetical protein
MEQLMTTPKQNKQLNEGLRKGDLYDLIDPNISIDRYKSKMGDDDQIVVVGLKAMHKEAAKDLVDFIESGYEWVLDANESPATDEKGKVTVFVEFNRRTTATDRLLELLSDLDHLTTKMDWTFSYYKNEYPLEVTEENLKIIPKSPKAYRDRLMQEQELDNMMMQAGLDPSKRYAKAPEDKDISFIQSIAKQ